MSVPLVQLDVTRAPDISDRRHRTFLREALRAAAVVHQLTKSPRHFQQNADTRPGGAYGYEQRTKKHQIRKARKYGHQDPLVFTGRERAAVLASARVTATFAKSRVVYKALHSRDADQGARWIREMEALSPAEAQEATQHAQDVYSKQADAFRRTRQRKRIS